MKVTINDIAKAANVAKSTVSKVLNDSPNISKATKERIRAIMKEMNYIPSSIATGLAKRKCNNIALMIDLSRRNDFLNHFFYNIIGGVESVVGAHDYDLTICNVTQGESRKFLNRYVLSQKADGMIIDTSILEKEVAADLEKMRYPFVVLGDWEAKQKFPCVDIDNRLGAVKITEHLLAGGYRRIAFIGGQKNESLFSRRFNGYSEVLRRQGYGVNPVWSFPDGNTEEIGYGIVKKLLRLPILPDALICMNNYVAFGALRSLQEEGFSVPEKMGIVTFDNEPLAPYTTPPLTSLNMDTFGLGVKAAEVLMTIIQDCSDKEEPELDDSVYLTWLEPQLVIRKSSVKSK
ncbi:HTH-type transcriptional repressor CytR [compost metagenome]